VKGYSSAVFESGEENRFDGRSVEELSVLFKKNGRHMPLLEVHEKQVHLFLYFDFLN
jgi:hypothetical protein